MFKNVILALVFSILMNWCISMQMLNQVSQSKNIKLIAVAIAVVLFVGAAAMMSCVPAVMMNKSLDPGVLFAR